ncbi:hypothetical protein [Deinococcus aluminii]|uniref:Uncharacterized protein n=1 Tax=Deinococcus aluminii TaxID=1656885 RepID=A0ABP9XEN5_9DEIO
MPHPLHPVNVFERELGLLPTGQRLSLTPDLAFTKTETHGAKSGAERCAGLLHTPAGDHPVLWDDDPNLDGAVTITLYDHTLLLSSGLGKWRRHHPLVGGKERP